MLVSLVVDILTSLEVFYRRKEESQAVHQATSSCVPLTQVESCENIYVCY